MLRLRGLVFGACPVAAIAAIVACTPVPVPPTPVPPSYSSTTAVSAAPFFYPSPNDAKTYRALAREQDLHLATCGQDRSCEQAHFSRALLALFENQRTAAKHFQEVVTAAPKSRLAAVSADWLKLLHDVPPDNERQSYLAKAAQSVILELLNRQQVVKEELSVREKKLEELSDQLETLKLIDQEMNEKAHRIRPRGRAPQSLSEPPDTAR